MFQTCLGLQKVPSSPILRQRLDAAAQTIDVNWNELLLLESAKLIRNVQAQVSGLEAGEHRYIPLDIDVSPFDNSGTKKEGGSRTYKGSMAMHQSLLTLVKKAMPAMWSFEKESHKKRMALDFCLCPSDYRRAPPGANGRRE